MRKDFAKKREIRQSARLYKSAMRAVILQSAIKRSLVEKNKAEV